MFSRIKILLLVLLALNVHSHRLIIFYSTNQLYQLVKEVPERQVLLKSFIASNNIPCLIGFRRINNVCRPVIQNRRRFLLRRLKRNDIYGGSILTNKIMALNEN